MACFHSSRPPAASRWVAQKRWSDNWVSIEELSGGGQGEAKRVRRKSDDQEAFLKAIKRRNDPERRGRFFREATAYDTMKSRGIPRLIESNAHLHDDGEAVLYIVTEFIEGPTLHEWRQAQSMVELDIAARTTRELLAILTMCHDSGFVHRDVKPDNIILAADDPGRPVLLDFGLTFHKAARHDLETEQGQELGNRFLRLTELSAGSSFKQDPRSDISFAAGILYFLLTGQHPNVLQDAEGRLPHQRGQVLETLACVAGSSFHRLSALFDRAFAPQIADRFMDADAMLAELDKVMEPRTGIQSEAVLQDIVDALGTEAAHRQAARAARLDEALKQIQRVLDEVRADLGSRGVTLIRSQGGWSVVEGLGRNTLGLVRPGSSDSVLSVVCEVREAGDEIVIHLSGEPVYRTSVASPEYGGQFDSTINSWLLDRLHDAVTTT